jgi:hypothetical protein
MIKIDWNYINTLEGGVRLDGYVPDDPDLHSGVTVTGGIDLGYLDHDVLERLPEALQHKLVPYIGYRGDAALSALRRQPLCLTEAEAITLMAAYRAPFVDLLQMKYRLATNILFGDLPGAVQTVIASVCWQYGDCWKDKKCGRFWAIACTRNWNLLVDYLAIPEKPDGREHFPDRRFRTRRRREAAYLKQHLNGDSSE